MAEATDISLLQRVQTIMPGLLVESFVRRMRQTYPQMDKYLPRARFYAQLLELEWVLRGLESGDTFWFTGHLGNARDILS